MLFALMTSDASSPEAGRRAHPATASGPDVNPFRLYPDGAVVAATEGRLTIDTVAAWLTQDAGGGSKRSIAPGGCLGAGSLRLVGARRLPTLIRRRHSRQGSPGPAFDTSSVRLYDDASALSFTRFCRRLCSRCGASDAKRKECPQTTAASARAFAIFSASAAGSQPISQEAETIIAMAPNDSRPKSRLTHSGTFMIAPPVWRRRSTAPSGWRGREPGAVARNVFRSATTAAPASRLTARSRVTGADDPIG